ncbi:MAG: VWA domain-containing protein [Bacteroidaceae bacterium]|nr:VWA domain-containing protein [Bacteroidaceae bacterium]
MEVLKDAVKKFVQVVYSKNPTEGDKHKIAIVKFASETAEGSYNGSETIYNLTDVTSGTQCNTVIDALQAGGGTQAADGLSLAYGILNATNVRQDGHSKVTVFFTDGVPGQTGWDSAEARTAVNNAYNLKGLETTLKINGEEVEDEEGNPIILESKVYSVGLLTSETASSTNDVRRYMHYVSSNYKFNITGDSYTFNNNHTSSKKLVNTGTEENPKWEYTGGTGGDEAYDSYPKARQYYQLTDGSDLTSIFESIASSSSNAPTIPLQLKPTDVVAVDVVSHSFKLPEGADASAIQVMVAPFTEMLAEDAINPKTGKVFTAGEISRLEHYQFGTPMTYAAAKAADDPVVPAYQADGTTEIVPAAAIDPNDRQKISVTGFNYADNWCGFDQHTVNGVVQNIAHGYELVIVIPIEVDPANPGGASVNTNDATSGIYISQDGGDPIFAGFPQPVVTLPNIIIRKYGLIYKDEGASFLLEKLNDAGTEVDTSVDPYRIVIVAADDNPNTFDFVQVKLNEPGRYRVTETDWGWSYTCTVKEGDMQENNDWDPNKTLLPSTNGTNAKGQPWIARDVSGDTEQTITLPGGSNLSGAVYDFQNTSKEHEKRNYSEAHKLNEFNTVYNQ